MKLGQFRSAHQSPCIQHALCHYTDAVIAAEEIEDEGSDVYRARQEALSASNLALMAVIDAHAMEQRAIHIAG